MTATNGDAILPITNGHKPQTEGIHHNSDDSQTAEEFINNQLQLEADAREVLPYQFDTCTRALGALRQSLFSCLTCNPPPIRPSDPYTAAGVCYSCSISCHGEHNLVELFTKRNFVCDCGTSRIPSTSPCSLRLNPQTGGKGGVHSETPAAGNKYNHNFQSKFCGCGDDYNPHEEKGTMFQCLGLGTIEEGGCGEDWWHPECIMGLNRSWYKKPAPVTPAKGTGPAPRPAIGGQNSSESVANGEAETYQATNVQDVRSPDGSQTAGEEEPPLPPGFPHEDDFDAFICYKCAEAFPWIKPYAGTPGFLPAVAHGSGGSGLSEQAQVQTNGVANCGSGVTVIASSPRKRKGGEDEAETQLKRQKSEGSPPSSIVFPTPNSVLATQEESQPSSVVFPNHSSVPARQGNSPHSSERQDTSPTRCSVLPQPPSNSISLFLKPDFRDHLCRCPKCFPLLAQHPQLLEEEEAYEPPLSADGDAGNGTGSIGTHSLLDRGEAALSNVDRVRAIEGVMVYNHLRHKVKSFLQPFAESGQAVGAEDIKAYFEKLRGDAEAIKAAAAKGGGDDAGGDGGDKRREQSGY